MVKIEIRECVKWSLTRGQKQWKIINSQAQKMVAVAHRRWSFTKGSNCKALTGKILVFQISGHLWKVRLLALRFNSSFTFPQLEMDNFHICLLELCIKFNSNNLTA